MLAIIQGIEEAFIWNLYQFTHMGSNLLFDNIFLIITKLGDFGFIWLLLSVLLLFSKKYRLLGVLVLITIALTTIEVSVLKYIVGRPRPFVLLPINPVLVSEAPLASFPSGHAATAFAAAVMLGFGLPKYRKYFLGLASLIAISRLYLAVHFPLDVLAGILIGTATTLLVLYVYVRIKGKNKNEIFLDRDGFNMLSLNR